MITKHILAQTHCAYMYAKITSRWVIWNAQFKLWFEWRYFGPCVRQITSRFVIWKAQFKWWSKPLFENHLNCAFQITHFGVHTVQTTVFWILIQNVRFELKLKLRTLLSCENNNGGHLVRKYGRMTLQMQMNLYFFGTQSALPVLINTIDESTFLRHIYRQISFQNGRHWRPIFFNISATNRARVIISTDIPTCFYIKK